MQIVYGSIKEMKKNSFLIDFMPAPSSDIASDGEIIFRSHI